MLHSPDDQTGSVEVEEQIGFWILQRTCAVSRHMILRKGCGYSLLRLLQPFCALLWRAGDDDAECFPMDFLDPAEFPDALLPQ